MRFLASVALVLLLAATCLAQPRQAFDTPEEAAEAAVQAAEQNDEATLSAIFGPGSKAILTSGDPKQDQQERAQFAKLARAKHQIEKDPLNANRAVLSIGSQDWPFPIPITKANGKWSFDATQGRLEMRARRIGANELDVIEVCAGYVEAQREYATRVRDKHGMLEYAQHISGPKEALYGQSDEKNLIPKQFAEAEAATNAKPYHGYYFRVLTSQGPNAPDGARNYLVKDSMIGGFGLAAWPAQYGITGIHSFAVNQDGVVFEKDFGGKAVRITRYDPDKTWARVD